MPLQVCPTDLVTSGRAVSGIGEDLAGVLSGVAGRLESASAGWQGDSAAALSVLASQWDASAAVLLGRLRELADLLDSCAQAFEAADDPGAL